MSSVNATGPPAVISNSSPDRCSSGSDTFAVVASGLGHEARADPAVSGGTGELERLRPERRKVNRQVRARWLPDTNRLALAIGKWQHDLVTLVCDLAAGNREPDHRDRFP
jgi:hypothetical protein